MRYLYTFVYLRPDYSARSKILPNVVIYHLILIRFKIPEMSRYHRCQSFGQSSTFPPDERIK